MLKKNGLSMFSILREETFQDDRTIYDEGQDPAELYVILSGAVKHVKEMRSENLVVEVMRTGDVFGALSFVMGSPRNATARAMGETTVGVIDSGSILGEINGLSPGLKKVLESLALRLKKATENSVGVSFIRKEPRVLKSLPVKLEKESLLLETTTHDVSCGGMFIKTDKPFSKGEVFLLHLELPGGREVIKIRSQVAWAREGGEDGKGRPPGMGVKFLRLSAEYRNRLKEFLESS